MRETVFNGPADCGGNPAGVSGRAYWLRWVSAEVARDTYTHQVFTSDSPEGAVTAAHLGQQPASLHFW